MDEFIKLTEYNWAFWIAGLFALFEFFKWIVTSGEWVLSKLKIETKGMKKKREEHELLIETVGKVSNLEDKDNAIKKDIDDILQLLKDHIETNKKNTQATFRSSLYRMHSDFTSRGFITKEGLRTFLECGVAYENAGGDDIYHDKLKPEIMKLPIREVDTDGVDIEDI